MVAEAPGKDVNFESLAAGQASGCTAAGDWLIRNEDDWASFWAMVYSGFSEPPARPSVDFGRESILATCMGSQTSGGYSTRFTAVAPLDETGRLDAWVEQVSPGGSCVVAGVISNPFEIVKVPGIVDEALVTHSAGTVEC